MTSPSNFVRFPGMIEQIKSLKDRTLKVMVTTMTELPAAETSIIFSLNQLPGFIAFKDTPIQTEDFADLPEVTVPHQKSPSQRLRGVLYRLWESQGKHGDFELYYTVAMERLIDQVKEKLT